MKVHWFMGILPLSAAAESTTLEDLRTGNIHLKGLTRRMSLPDGCLGIAKGVAHRGLRLSVDLGVLSVTVNQEGYQLTSRGEPVDVGNIPFEQAMCEKEALYLGNDDAREWCDKQMPWNRLADPEYAPMDVKLIPQNFISFSCNRPPWRKPETFMTSKQLSVGIARLLNHPRVSFDGESYDFEKVDSSYVRLIGSTGEAAGLRDEVFKNLATVLNKEIESLQNAQCFKIFSESNPQGWMFAYGDDYDNVMRMNCTNFDTGGVIFVKSSKVPWLKFFWKDFLWRSKRAVFDFFN